MSKKKYRRFSKAFKREALQLLESGDKTMAEIERGLGISPGLLSKWRKRYQLNGDDQFLESSDLQAAQRVSLSNLQRENYSICLKNCDQSVLQLTQIY